MEAIKIKECFDFLYLNERYLSASQTEFIAGLKRYYHKNKELSEKQMASLLEIKKYLKVPEKIRFTNKHN